MQPVASADRAAVDYTNWTNEDLAKLRSLQREEGAADAEVEAVESELRRRNPAPPRVAALAASPAVRPPSSAPPRSIAPNGRTEPELSQMSNSAPEPESSVPPPFTLANGSRSFVSVLTKWLVVVAVLAGLGGGSVTYYACESVMSSGPALLMTMIGAFIVATPYFAVVAFMDLASETAQGVTWIANFMHERN